ncbi:hypothetical protein RIF29_04606 [Crotalaria pallida]|uniref:Uncharacterized protein n=1 Tax=Crotalaria pallida TaxID=3830 RepID=A0AAN9J165_CROPI
MNERDVVAFSSYEQSATMKDEPLPYEIVATALLHHRGGGESKGYCGLGLFPCGGRPGPPPSQQHHSASPHQCHS